MHYYITSVLFSLLLLGSNLVHGTSILSLGGNYFSESYLYNEYDDLNYTSMSASLKEYSIETLKKENEEKIKNHTIQLNTFHQNFNSSTHQRIKSIVVNPASNRIINALAIPLVYTKSDCLTYGPDHSEKFPPNALTMLGFTTLASYVFKLNTSLFVPLFLSGNEKKAWYQFYKKNKPYHAINAFFRNFISYVTSMLFTSVFYTQSPKQFKHQPFKLLFFSLVTGILTENILTSVYYKKYVFNSKQMPPHQNQDNSNNGEVENNG